MGPRGERPEGQVHRRSGAPRGSASPTGSPGGTKGVRKLEEDKIEFLKHKDSLGLRRSPKTWFGAEWIPPKGGVLKP